MVAVNDPEQAWEDFKGMGEESWKGLEEFWDDTKDVGSEFLDVAGKTKDLIFGDGDPTDEGVEKKVAEPFVQKKGNLENLLGDDRLSQLSLIKKFIETGDEEGLKQFLDSPDGKFLMEILNKVNGTLKDVKDFQEVDPTKYPKQTDVNCDNPSTACTFTGDYILAMLLTSYSMLSIDDVARLAKQYKIIDSDMSVGNNDTIAKLSGAKDVSIENTATYIDVPRVATSILKNNAEATADWINILNNGAKLMIRVGPTPGVIKGHSVVVYDYYVSNQGKIEFAIIDPLGEYSRYDPQTQRLFKMEGNDRANDEKRIIINYLKATKK